VQIRSHLYAAAAALALLILTAAPASAAPAPCGPQADSAKNVSRQVVCLINAERARTGARKLHRRARLNKVAFRLSDRMVDRNVFSHLLGGNPVQRILGTGYARGSSDWDVAETIAWIRPGEGPGAAIAAWLASPVHRAILRDRQWRDVGVGTVRGSPFAGLQGGYTVTAEFGRR
jgi:uncharacterized protein YkwD